MVGVNKMSGIVRLLMTAITFLMIAKNLTAENNDDQFKATTYGSFMHFESVPNALFLFDNIKEKDTLNFRKALRNHQIETIILSSPGGQVFEGLQMAGIVYDRKLTTFVPKFDECVSACAFMFFAGHTKIAAGELGVHQFSKSEESKKTKDYVGITDYVSQYTVSEIVGFLNEFHTPPFVYERMFATKEMYYFSSEELKIIGASKNKTIQTEKTLTWAWDENNKRLVPNLAENEDLNRIQLFLDKLYRFWDERELLCYRATENNVWSKDPSKQAFVEEAKQKGLSCQVSETLPIASSLGISTEKQNYRVGDNIEIIIQPKRECRLTLINIDDEGDSCIMFPHPQLSDRPIPGGSRYVFPPKGTLKFSETGIETVIAICNYSAAAIDAVLRDTSKVSCDKTQLANPEVKILDSAIFETFTFDVNGGNDRLSGDIKRADAETVGRTIAKAAISISVGPE